MIEYIKNQDHYNKVLSLSSKVGKTLWIGTADIKDLHVRVDGSFLPYLAVLSVLVRRGVAIRIIHAKKPGENFMRDFARYENLKNGIEMMQCPRVHFKILLFDNEKAYMGSANLTGAALGVKNENRRNFEAGVLTDNEELVGAAVEHFDGVWRGDFCEKCGRKQYCNNIIK